MRELQRVVCLKKIIFALLTGLICQFSFCGCVVVLCWLQYMQTFRNCVGTPQSVLQLADIDVIFYGIPELHMAHKFFVRELEPCITNWSADQQIGEMFYTLVSVRVAFVLMCRLL